MTRVIKSEEKAVFSEVANCLKGGGVIIYPTETLYGIGCIAFNEQACQRILNVKNRPESKGMILLVRDAGMMKEHFKISIQHIENYSKVRGALTLVLEAKTKFPDVISGENKNVAVRISGSPFVKELFNHIDQPITSTSANLSGEKNDSKIENICKNFMNKVDLIVDSGSLPTSKGSTIVDLTQNPPITIRQGELSRKDIEDFING